MYKRFGNAVHLEHTHWGWKVPISNKFIHQMKAYFNNHPNSPGEYHWYRLCSPLFWFNFIRLNYAELGPLWRGPTGAFECDTKREYLFGFVRTLRAEPIQFYSDYYLWEFIECIRPYYTYFIPMHWWYTVQFFNLCSFIFTCWLWQVHDSLTEGFSPLIFGISKIYFFFAKLSYNLNIFDIFMI